MSLFFPANRGQGNPWGLFVPPLSAQRGYGPGSSLEGAPPPCRTEGCRWHGHPEFGGLCSTCGEGWTPQRLEQLRLLAKEAEAETRARDFEDWDEPGVTFSPQEYDWLRRGVERWAADAGAPDSFGAMIFVSKLLLESHRLLTPEQARGLWRAVEPMVLDVHDQVAGEARSKFVVLLASFLRSPERWCRIPPHVREEFWPDEAKHGGTCTWSVCAPYTSGSGGFPYNEILRMRLPLFRESKLMAAACLRRTTLPESVKRRIRNARGRPGPDIPPLLVKRIFLWCAPGWFAPTQARPEYSRWMFAPNQVRPEASRWMVCNAFRSSGDDESGEWFNFLDHMRRRPGDD